MMQAIKIVDFSEFKRGMLGLLKLLMYEAMESQRLDHYAMYKAMADLADAWDPALPYDSVDELLREDEESIARMILNFPRDSTDPEEPPRDTGTDYA